MSNVKTVINTWDPIDLLSHAPKDEYHSEIKEVEELLKSTNNVYDLAEGIYNIFLNSFGQEAFQKTKYDCILIAKKLL